MRTGKSNLMDAISFVLGVSSRHLRGKQLRDLVFQVEGEQAPRRRAMVELVYQLSAGEMEDRAAGEELTFTRIIAPTGTSTYRLNNRECTWEEYDTTLRGLKILVHARNFLVFQGDVESIAAKKPKDLCALLEKISGADQLAAQFDELLRAKEEAEQQAVFSHQKNKGVRAERKQVREEKEEADRFQSKQDEFAELRTEYFLWQLFHIDRRIDQHQEEVRVANERIEDTSHREGTVEAERKARKKERARRHRVALQEEERLKAARAEVDNLRPQLIQHKGAVTHAQKQLKGHEAGVEKVRASASKMEAEVAQLEKDLRGVERELAAVERELEGAESRSRLSLSADQLAEYERRKQEARNRTMQLREELDKVRGSPRPLAHACMRTCPSACRAHTPPSPSARAQLSREQTAAEERLGQLRRQRDEQTARQGELETELRERQERFSRISDSRRQMVRQRDGLRAAIAETRTGIEADAKRRAEVAARLEAVEQQVGDAQAERQQSSHEQKMEECRETMKRLFPGVRGRLADLCKPVQRRYNVAVTVALGRHMDAIVVDDQKTGFQCIDVSARGAVNVARALRAG